jgi:hypothetical protein
VSVAPTEGPLDGPPGVAPDGALDSTLDLSLDPAAVTPLAREQARDRARDSAPGHSPESTRESLRRRHCCFPRTVAGQRIDRGSWATFGTEAPWLPLSRTRRGWPFADAPRMAFRRCAEAGPVQGSQLPRGPPAAIGSRRSWRFRPRRSALHREHSSRGVECRPRRCSSERARRVPASGPPRGGPPWEESVKSGTFQRGKRKDPIGLTEPAAAYSHRTTHSQASDQQAAQPAAMRRRRRGRPGPRGSRG